MKVSGNFVHEISVWGGSLSLASGTFFDNRGWPHDSYLEQMHHGLFINKCKNVQHFSFCFRKAYCRRINEFLTTA